MVDVANSGQKWWPISKGFKSYGDEKAENHHLQSVDNARLFQWFSSYSTDLPRIYRSRSIYSGFRSLSRLEIRELNFFLLIQFQMINVFIDSLEFTEEMIVIILSVGNESGAVWPKLCWTKLMDDVCDDGCTWRPLPCVEDWQKKQRSLLPAESEPHPSPWQLRHRVC